MTDDVSTEALEDIVVRAQLGEKEAYDQIVRRFQDMAFSYAYSILGDHELAEDARQEAFMAAYCNLLTLREPAAFPGWLRTLVHRHSVNIVRGRRELVVAVDETGERDVSMLARRCASASDTSMPNAAESDAE